MTDEAALLAIVRGAFAAAGALGAGARDLGDDVGVLEPPAPGTTRVVTADSMHEGRHFSGQEPAPSVGHRAVLRNLSDLAAAGARPVGMIWTLGVDPDVHGDFLRGFCAGAARLCAATGLLLLGGDITRSARFLCSVTAFGDSPRLPGRGGARPGDNVCVFGTVGQGAAGRRQLGQGGQGPLVEGYLWPRPRLDEGAHIAPRATACLDVSDGLALDLHRLCRRSAVGAVLTDLDAARAPGATVDDALYGGDDYALLFTWPGPPPPGAHAIGHIEAGSGVFVEGPRGRWRVPARGHDPFSRRSTKPC